MNAALTDAEERNTAAQRQFSNDIDKLGATALMIRDQRDVAVGALRDLHFGARMLLDSGVWTGAALSYIKEVKRVALAALQECDVLRPQA